jgi:hypothetical protein
VDSVGSGQGPVTGFCEHGDEPSGSGTTDLVILVRVTDEFVKVDMNKNASYYELGYTN